MKNKTKRMHSAGNLISVPSNAIKSNRVLSVGSLTTAELYNRLNSGIPLDELPMYDGAIVASNVRVREHLDLLEFAGVLVIEGNLLRYRPKALIRTSKS
jgi:hypothetical protein